MGTQRKVTLSGEAKIGRILMPSVNLSLDPEDFSSPVALQMALSKLIEQLSAAFEEPPKPRYIAEVRLVDAMGTPVRFAIDLGESLPPFSKEKVKAKITVELYEDEEEREDLE